MIFQQPLNRPVPRLDPQHFKTYEVSRPRSTHFRLATCAEVDCPNRARGWKSIIDVSTSLGQKQASYIRLHSGRAFEATGHGEMITFTFPAGQNCFSEHMVPLDREPVFRKLDGDWRHYSNAQQLRARDWLDDFGEHQERLAAQRERG